MTPFIEVCVMLSDTESDQRWGWLGLACETKGHDGCGAILSRLRETNGAIVSYDCVLQNKT